jgi:CRISPR-associated protein Cmr3
MRPGFSFKIRKSSDYICSELKVGIGRDDQTRTSGDTGKLYRVGLQRLSARGGMSRLELAVVYENLSVPDSGILKMGAEGKCVSYRTESMPNFDISDLRQSESRRFKLYLMTPGIFDRGWVADWMLQGAYNGINFDFIGAASGRSMHMGGFDMKQGKPKPMRKAVPAGSVYYFELKDGKTVGGCFETLFEAFHCKALEGQSSDKKKEGYGIALLGTGA